jgi:KDO2-lipid IV(A) lauroyltransferase
MQALGYYLTYPFIYLITALPFGLLYRVSDGLYYLLRMTRYRREVIFQNLQRSFPEKNVAEIETLVQQYYRYLCDLTLEILKTRTMTEQDSQKHCVFHPAPWLDQLYHEKRSIIILMGHYGNWEWAGPSFTLNNRHQLVVIYLPLSNPYFDKMMVRTRTRFGTRIAPASQTFRAMAMNREQMTATAFIADQAAPVSNNYWMTFLNQDTSVFTGPAKVATKLNYPIIYIHVKRTARGYYDVYPELLFNNPSQHSEGEICEVYMRRLEKDIQADPVAWLWSHRRWKHVRQQPVQGS